MKYSLQSTLKYSASALIMASIILAPTTGFAKEREDRGDRDDNERKDRKEEQMSEREFRGSLFSNWFNNRGLHIGWFKNWFRPNATSTPSNDNTAPNISSLEANMKARQAIVTWKTDEKSNSLVYYSTDSAVDTTSSTTKKVRDGGWTLNHKVVLGGLEATTTYHAFVVSKDPRGNTATSSKISFTTTGTNLDVRAPNISDININIGTSTAKVEWETNEPATSKVYYSTTTVATSSAPFVENTSLVNNHEINLSSLSTSTLYNLLIESKDSSGNTKVRSGLSLTTEN